MSAKGTTTTDFITTGCLLTPRDGTRGIISTNVSAKGPTTKGFMIDRSWVNRPPNDSALSSGSLIVNEFMLEQVSGMV